MEHKSRVGLPESCSALALTPLIHSANDGVLACKCEEEENPNQFLLSVFLTLHDIDPLD